MSTQLSRRSAGQLGAALALAPWLSGLAAPAPVADRLWKTAVGLNGFQSGSRKYKKNYPIWEVLDFAARNGFDGVELVGDWPAGGYPGARETGRVRALRRLYDQYGVGIFSIQIGADRAFDPEAEVRRRWVEEVADRLQLAAQLGCACVGMWPGGGLRGQTLEVALDRLCESFRRVADLAAEQKILACFEIEPPFVFNQEAHYHEILRRTNHPNFKGIYDPSHFDLMSGSTGRPEEMLKRVGARQVGYLQFCDTDGKLRDGGTSTHLGCGDGHTDCTQALRWLKQQGWRGWIMMDEWEVPDPYDACLKGKKAVDQVLAG
jgi:sugar phosphate isomerase/epimerase